MNNIKYFFQFVFIVLLFFIFKLIGYKFSIILSGKILNIIGPLFRSKNICLSNLSIAFPKMSNEDKENIIKKMWNNYGKIFAEYMFISNFRKKIQVGYVYRYAETYQLIDKLIKKKKLGDVLHCNLKIYGLGAHKIWKHQNKFSGGVIFEMLSHIFLLDFFFLK